MAYNHQYIRQQRHGFEDDLSADDDLIVDDVPEISTEVNGRINPIVFSSRDKVGCAAGQRICKKMVYPPRQLCESCEILLEHATALKIRKQSQEEYQRISAHNRTSTKQQYVESKPIEIPPSNSERRRRQRNNPRFIPVELKPAKPM